MTSRLDRASKPSTQLRRTWTSLDNSSAGSGPLGRILPQPASHDWLRWRPLLLLLSGLLISATVGFYLAEWPQEWMVGLSALLSLLLILPTALMEYRSRCLIGPLPCLLLFFSAPDWWWIAACIPLLLLAYILSHIRPVAAPEGLRQRLLAKQLQRYPVLHAACQRLATAQNREQVAKIVVEEALCLGIAATAATVYLPVDGLLCLSHRSGLSGVDASEDPDIAFVARTGERLLRRQQGRQRLLLPLRWHNQEMHGVLDISLLQDVCFDDFNQEMEEALARMASIALGTADIIEQSRALALRDDLTGLFGQQEIRRRGSELIADMRRTQQALALILCDLDHLKQVNDQHGHACGDAVLCQVAQVLISEPLAEQRCGRWGGEEFVLLLPACTQKKALAHAERLRSLLASSVLRYEEVRLYVSASFGVAMLDDKDSFDSLMERADLACYQAKDQGRNRVCLAESQA